MVNYRKKTEDDEKTYYKIVEDQIVVLQTPAANSKPTEVFFAALSEKFKVTLKGDNLDLNEDDDPEPSTTNNKFCGQEIAGL